jgi:hypothetical protein
MKRLILLFCFTSLSASANQEQMMSIINKKAEISAADYLEQIIQGTICKWKLTEEERLFIESSY